MRDAVVVLGAGGRLGRMVRAFWQSPAPLVPMDWRGGMPFPDGAAGTILALWGSVEDPSRHPGLAVAALDLGVALGAERVVHCSSAAVYARASGMLSEGAVTAENSLYSGAKLAMEQGIARWHDAHPDGPRSVILRIGNVAGADSLFGNLRPGGHVTLHRFPDGQGPRRSYLAPIDLCRALERIVGAGQMQGTFNLAAPGPTAMEAIARAANASIHWENAPGDATASVHLDVSKLLHALPGLALQSDPGFLVENARASGVWPS